MHILSDQQFQQITAALEQAFVAINAAQHVDLDLTVKPTVVKAPAVKAESQRKTRKSKSKRKVRGALTESNVLEIKRMLNNNSRSMAQIARDYGVHYTTVTHIKAGKTWKHVTLQQEQPTTVVF